MVHFQIQYNIGCGSFQIPVKIIQFLGLKGMNIFEILFFSHPNTLYGMAQHGQKKPTETRIYFHGL